MISNPRILRGSGGFAVFLLKIIITGKQDVQRHRTIYSFRGSANSGIQRRKTGSYRAGRIILFYQSSLFSVLLQRVHTYTLLTCPLISSFILWTLALKDLTVCLFEWLTFLPAVLPFPHSAHTLLITCLSLRFRFTVILYHRRGINASDFRHVFEFSEKF